MHEFILGFFKFLRNVLYLIKIIAVFCVLMLLFYWVQNLTGGHWNWLEFITPFLDSLLKLANSIYSISFDVFGVKFELKYVSAIVILLLFGILMEVLTVCVNLIEGLYKSGRFLCRKAEEAAFNKTLENDMKRSQKSLAKYLVAVNTYEKPKNPYSPVNVNLEEQNIIMNKFIMEKTNSTPSKFEDGFLYSFNNFEQVDKVLDVLFRVLGSKAPIDYAICVQISTGNPIKDKELIKRLVKLKYTGKITTGSDTAYRYSYNDIHIYETTQLGIFQTENGDTMEVHEFKNNL